MSNVSSKLTLAQARIECKALHFSITKRDGEYRVAPLDVPFTEREAKAYYTNDIHDAVGTARLERERVNRGLSRFPMAATTARGAFAEHASYIEAQLDLLRLQFDNLMTKNINWNHVGTIEHVRNELSKLSLETVVGL
jgi:hypothetical protein